jgi:hypothetical protein
MGRVMWKPMGQPAVRRPVELGGVGFERVCAELLDIDRDRRPRRCGRKTSKRAGVPSALVRSGSPCVARALFEVTRGGVF